MQRLKQVNTRTFAVSNYSDANGSQESRVSGPSAPEPIGEENKKNKQIKQGKPRVLVGCE